jgi:hypothetical protein
MIVWHLFDQGDHGLEREWKLLLHNINFEII